VSEFVSPQWVKTKNIEREIFEEHKKFMGLLDTQSKYRYLQLVRSLRTYGVTFFEMRQEFKNVKKDKLAPVLLGLSKDRIILADFETKQNIKEWAFKRLKRWTASSTVVTLDFGDWHDEILYLNSPESNNIADLLTNYIDLILKARKGTYIRYVIYFQKLIIG